MEKPTYEESFPELVKIVEKFRPKWQLKAVAWIDFDDIAQHILRHIFIKWHLFDPRKGTLVVWASMVARHQIKNELDKIYLSSRRPCLDGKGGCPYNTGGDGCAIYGIQSTACPAFLAWVKSGKSDANNLRMPMSINASIGDSDGHTSLLDLIGSDKSELNFEKLILEFKEEIFKLLSPFEQRVYQKIYIENYSDRDAAKFFGYDLHKNEEESGKETKGGGVRIIKEIKKRIYEKAKLAVANVI